MSGSWAPKSWPFRRVAGAAAFALVVLLVTGVVYTRLHRESSPVPYAAPVPTPSPAASTAGIPGPVLTPLPPVRPVAGTTAGAVARADAKAWNRIRQPQEFFADGVVLDSRDSAPDRAGRFERVLLLRTSFKYPLIRVVETVGRDPRTGVDTILKIQAMVADHVLVKLHNGIDEAALTQLAAKHDGAVRKKMLAPGTYLVEFKNPTLDTVTRAIDAFTGEVAHVQYAEPDTIQYALAAIPNDTRFSELWGMHNEGQTGGKLDADIDAPEAWDQCKGSKATLVGVIDTGVDYTHEDLASNMWVNPGETGLDSQSRDRATNGVDDDNNGFIDDWHGWDFANDDNDPFDDNSHGSHCSGTIGGVGNNSVGVAGVCWNVSIVGLKFLSGGGSGSLSDAVDAVYYGTLIGVRLTSNSWGGGGYSQALYDAIEDANAHGILFVAAAGNSSEDNDTAFNYPASLDNRNILSVAAIDHADELAYFSCYGVTTVDLGAPGVDILSCIPGNSYEKYKGTSMATPHVSGAAALAWSFHPSSTHLEIRDAILASAEPIAALSGKTVSGGRLNVAAMLRRLGMGVTGSTPAADEVVFTRPTQIVIQLSDAYDAGTVDATDLQVNGIPATSVATTASNLLTFSYASSPVTTQGLQSLFMSAGTVQRLSDHEGLREWNVGFRYDSLAIAVTSTVPANGATVTLPFTNLVVNLNEPVGTGSVEAADLVISQGSVIAARILNATTVAFSLSGISEEKRLTVGIPPGALTDVYGNPNVAYSGGYDVDIDVVAHAASFVAGEPAGSLVAVSMAPPAFVMPAGDTDSYTLDLDAGQSVALAVAPGPALTPSVWLLDPSRVPLGTNSASVAGREATVQSVAIANAGRYTMGVGGQGTTGTYTLAVYINTAMENEAHGGSSNDTLATAQAFDTVSIPLTAGATRAAVLGTLSASTTTPTTVLSAPFESGLDGFAISNSVGAGGGLWHRTSARPWDPGHSATGSLYYGANEKLPLGGDYETGRTNSGACYSPLIHIPAEGRTTLSFKHFLSTENRAGYDVSEVAVCRGAETTVLLSSSNGTLADTTGGVWAAVSAGLDGFAGADIVIRFRFDTVDSIGNSFEGWYVDDIAVTTAPVAEDWYRFDLATNDSAMLVLEKASDSTAGLELYNAAHTLLARGGRTGRIESITNIAGSACFTRITGSTSDYALVMTRNAFFDLGGNDRNDLARDITGCRAVLGSVGTSGGLFGIDGELWASPVIHRLDPATGNTGASFEAPGVLFDSECAFDGENLWYSAGGWYYWFFLGDITIYKLDPETGAIRDEFLPDVPSTVTGLGWLNGELYATEGTKVYVYDDTTYVLTRILSPPWDPGIVGLSGDYGQGVLWGLSSATHRIYKVQPETGEILAEGVSTNTAWENGLAVIGNELFVSESDYNTKNYLAVYDADTLLPLRRMEVHTPKPLYGIGGDVGSAEDWYAVFANAGDSLTIGTLTPAGDPQYPFELHNGLDPVLALYDPAGAVAAANDNGAADGKNARITHVALQTGPYALSVQGTDKTVGNYVLTVSGATGTGGVSSTAETLIFSEALDADPGWLRGGRWAFGAPRGYGGSCGNPDPAQAHTGNNVFGYNLNGDYESGIATNYCLTTRAIDCSAYQDIKLRFWRWLGIEAEDRGRIQVSGDGTTWFDVWQNPAYASLTDGQWKQVEYDLSSFADGRSTVYLRWGLGPTDGGGAYCGWNLDDVQLVGTRLAGSLFFFSTPSPAVGEAGGTASISVSRVGVANQMASVRYATSNGTAAAGTDYTSASGTLWFAAGVMTNSFTLPILNDSSGEWDETVNCFLGNPSSGAGVGKPDAAVLTINDDDGHPGFLQFSSPLYTVNETDGVANVTVTRTDGSWGAVTIAFSTSNETATAGTDYLATNGVLTFAAGVTSRTFSVSVVDDKEVESLKTLRLRLSNPTGNALAGSVTSAALRIVSDDNMIYHEYFDANPGWGMQGDWQFGVPQGRGGEEFGSPDPVAGYTGANGVGYNLAGDYTNDLYTTHYLTSPAINCTNRENVTLRFQRWLDIENSMFDEASIQVSRDGTNWVDVWMNDYYSAVLDSTWTNVEYDISATADGQSRVYVRWGLGPTDWLINCCGWNLDDVEILGDVALADKARLDFAAATYEVMEHAGTAVVTVARSWNTNLAVSVDYATFDGGATGGVDYTTTTGTLAFASGVMTRTLLVPILDNGNADGDRDLRLAWVGISPGAVYGVQSNATLTIVDDDRPGSLQFECASTRVNETNGTLSLKVIRTRGRRGAVSVGFSTRNGTAGAGSDYGATNGTLVFADNATNGTVTVAIVNDVEIEAPESFYVDLDNPTNGAVLGKPSYAMVTLTSEDGVALSDPLDTDPGWTKNGAWQFGAPQGKGGDYGYPDPTSGHTGTNVFGYNLAGDYEPDISGTYYLTTRALNCANIDNVKLKFWRWLGVEDPMFDNAEIQVSNNGSTWTRIWSNTTEISDSAWTLVEYDLSAVADRRPAVYIRWGMGPVDWSGEYCGWNIDDVEVTGTPVISNTARLAFLSPTYTVMENQGTAAITVSRTWSTNGAASVGYSTSNGTAFAGSDYTMTSGTLFFAAGITNTAFNVPILNDSTGEWDETVFLFLAGPSSNAVLGAASSAVLTLRDDEGTPGTLQFSASRTTVNETNAALQVRVTRTNGSAGAVSVEFATRDGTARAGSDYAATNGVLALGGGVTGATFSVALVNDDAIESPETLFLSLGNPGGGATLGAIASATVTILNDDGVFYAETMTTNPGWTAQALWQFGVPQGLGGGWDGSPDPTAGFTGANVVGFNLAGDYNSDMTTTAFLTTKSIDCSGREGVKLAFWRWLGVEDGYYDGAVIQVSNNGADWTSVWSNESSVADSEWKHVEYDISAVADGQSTVTLRWGMGPTDDYAEYCGWNLDDVELIGAPLTNSLLAFRGSAVSVNETAGTVVISVVRSGITNGPGSVGYATHDGTARAGWDYTATTGTLWFAAGVRSNTVSIPLLNDTKVEGDETLTLTLGSPSNAILGLVSNMTLTIVDDEKAGVVQFAPPAYTVGETAGVARVTVVRRDGSAGAISVDYRSTDGTAVGGTDYQPVVGTLVMGAGVTSATFTVTVLDDGDVESSKDLYVFLENPRGSATLGTADVATVTIDSDDGVIFRSYFDTNPGWTTTGQWAFGVPQGLGGSSGYPDPTSGHSGANVYGYNLSGDYPADMVTTYYLTTPAINCANRTGVKLAFWRWLGAEYVDYDHANIQVSSNGVTWVDVWSNNTWSGDFQWTSAEVDISSVADGCPTVYIRWGMGPTDGWSQYCGWNIDDVTVYGIPPAVWTLEAVAGPNGSIAPSGSVQVSNGGKTNFTFAPAQYFHIEGVFRDGASMGAVSNYLWTNITAYGTIMAQFEPDLAPRGTPHYWLANYGLTNNNFNVEEVLDRDGDGMKAWEEWIAGTVPTNALSYLGIVGVSWNASRTGMVLRWDSQSGRTYSVWWGTNIQSPYSVLTNGVPYPQGACTDTTHAASRSLYYRIGVTKSRAP